MFPSQNDNKNLKSRSTRGVDAPAGPPHAAPHKPSALTAALYERPAALPAPLLAHVVRVGRRRRRRRHRHRRSIAVATSAIGDTTVASGSPVLRQAGRPVRSRSHGTREGREGRANDGRTDARGRKFACVAPMLSISRRRFVLPPRCLMCLSLGR